MMKQEINKAKAYIEGMQPATIMDISVFTRIFELVMIYYNGFSHARFKNLIERYAILNSVCE